jgi:hypothetical protein
MTSFRVETKPDGGTGHFFAEVYGEPGGELIARSGAIFANAEEAEQRFIDAIVNAWPLVPADPVYPAGGS